MNALSFKGKGLEYFKIWIVNILLTIITLGLYYPWAKVRNRRYLYANTTLNDRNFEYHATGKQLFIGFLIAMGIFIAYVVLQQVAPSASLIVFFLFMLGLPWIIWRSLMFNMRMTSFSNVRFSFQGELGGAYFNYLLLPLLFFFPFFMVFFVIGVIAGFMGGATGVAAGLIYLLFSVLGVVAIIYVYGVLNQRNVSYVVNSTRYGQGQFSTNLQVIEFVKILLKTTGLMIIGFIGFMLAVGLLAMMTGMSEQLLPLAGAMDDPEAMTEAMEGGVLGLIALIYLGFIIVSVIVFSYSYTRKRAYIFANSKLDDKVSLASTLSARKVAFISITNFLAIIFTLGLAVPWATVRLTRYIVGHTEVDTSAGFDEYLTQQQAEQSSLGEQIGDAFDVDVGIGI